MCKLCKIHTYYQYTVLGFGLVNSPAVWSTCIQNVLRDLIGKDCLVYIPESPQMQMGS